MLEEQVNKDYIQAMKNRDSLKSSTLSFLRAQFKNARLESAEKREKGLDDTEVITIIKKQIKQRQESISQYEKGGRQDLAEKETAEMAILKNYLPEEMSEAELEKSITDAIAEVGASSMKDMGSVMKVVTARAQGRADNKLVSEIVKRMLSQL